LVRLRKLFTVHGDSALSSFSPMSPAVVAMVTSTVPWADTPLAGGAVFGLAAACAGG